MTDFPTVGLGVDLTGIDQGDKAYQKLEKQIDAVGDAAERTANRVQASASRTKGANVAAGQSEAQRARASQKASADEARAEAQATREKERQRRYLQQVRIKSIQMEEAARRADQVEEARAAAQQQREAMRAAADQARRDRAVMAEQERNRKYLLSVRLNSIRMEEQAAEKAAAEAQRLQAQQLASEKRAISERMALERSWARERARAAAAGGGGRGGGAVPLGLGGTGGGSPIRPGDVSLMNRFGAAVLGLRHSLTDVRRLFLDVRTAVGIFLAGMVIRPILDMADAMTALKARAGAFTDAATDVPYLMEAIFQAAQRSRAPLESIATLYTRLAPLAKQLGKSQLELLRISETVAKGFQIGGATPEEARSASQQLAQALASNRLGGDELRSLAENAPILMQKIAQSLNMNTGQFIKWAQSGKANAQIVIKALEDASAEIDRLFAKFPVTIAQSVTLVKNALAELISRVNDATGASQAIANFIAQFAQLLESERTIKLVTQAVNLLGQAFGFLGQAIDVLRAAIPVIVTLLAVMAVTRLMAIVRAWGALRTALLAYEAAAVISGRATATLVALQSGLAVAAAETSAAIGALTAALGGGLGVALIAVAGAFAYFSNAAKGGREALEKGKTATADNVTTMAAAAAKAETLGLNTDALTAAIAGYVDASRLGSAATQEAANKHDVAMDAAMARAQAEQALTAAILTRRAAELDEDADKAQKAAGARRFLLTAARAVVGGRTSGGAGQDDQVRQLETQGMTNRAQAGQMRLLAAQVMAQKPKITRPDTHGEPAKAPPPLDKNKWEGAIDQIAKMRAEVEGLQAAINRISANPLAALNEQIIAAGNEAAARFEAGSKQNEKLAAEARDVAQQKERLTILKALLEESAKNTRQTAEESDSYKLLADAQLQSTQIMKDFWASGSDNYDAYTQALQDSRQVLTDAQVAEAKLLIARRYGVDSIGDISEAVVKYTGATEENAQKLEDQAKAEGDAAEAAIRRKAVLDALASHDADVQAFDEQTYAGAERALQHMALLADNLGNSLAAAFGRGGESLQRLLGVMTNYQAKQLDANKRVAEARTLYDTNGKRSVQSLKIEKEASEELAQARIESYADMAAAAADFYGKGTAGYEVLKKAEMAFRLYEFAMSAKSIIVKTAETAAKIGLFGAQAQAAAAAGAANMFATLGPLGFAAVAAMVAVLAGFGLSIGSGGGSAPISQMENRQKAQGAGSVLGDATAKSESIARSLDIVAANSNADLEFSNDMLTALRSIDENISVLTASLARQLNVGGFLSTDGLGLGTKQNAPGLGGIFSGGIFGKPMIGLLSKIPVIGGIIKTLFGSKTTTSLLDAGLSFQGGSLSSVLSGGIQGNTYQDLASQTKKKFFGLTYSNKTSYSTVTGGIDQDIRDEITRVIASLRDGVLSAAALLGVTGAQAALDAMTVDLGKLSFKDMSGEEIEQALQAVFSKLGDDMATIALPMITSLQKAGEGALETLSRVARDYVVLDTALASVGQTFGAVGISSLAARERLISLAGGIDELSGQIDQYGQDFLTDAERIAPIITAVYTELGKLGYGAITTKDQFKDLVRGLDLTTEEGASTFATLMKIAPAFAKIVDYTDSLKVANDNVTKAQGDLNDEYDTAVGLIGDVHDKFAAFVDTFKRFRQSLETGPLALNSPQDQYLKSKALFESTRDRALGGDEQALNDLQSVSEAYLQASQDYYASTEPYFQDLAEVKAAVEAAQAYSQTQVDVADQQLAALNTMVAGQVTLNNSVLTVASAVAAVAAGLNALAEANAAQAAALAAAQAAAVAAANAAANTNTPPTAVTTATAANDNSAAWTAAGYLANNPDIQAAANNLLATADPNSPWYTEHGLDKGAEGFAAWHWATQGQLEPGRKFAMGSAFDQYGVVNTPTPFNADWMGEEGPEAVLPLARTSSGELGVQVAGSSGGDDKNVVAALDRLTNEVKKNNVLAQAGHLGTIQELKQVKEGVADLRPAIRKAGS